MGCCGVAHTLRAHNDVRQEVLLQPTPRRVQAVHWQCKGGTHNDLATGFWSSPDELISRLFSVGHGHDAETAGDVTIDSTGFSQGGLLLYSAVYLTMLALCAGICVPAGMFMPAVVLGAATGLAAGVALQQNFPELHIQPGAPPPLRAHRVCRLYLGGGPP